MSVHKNSVGIRYIKYSLHEKYLSPNNSIRNCIVTPHGKIEPELMASQAMPSLDHRTQGAKFHILFFQCYQVNVALQLPGTTQDVIT